MTRAAAKTPTRCRGDFERRARAAGRLRIAGVDEAGRGCLFGPVFAAAVILPDPCPIRGLRDSKQLPPERRQELADAIRAQGVAWAVGRAEADEIDRINILEASRLAMRRAVEQLDPPPDLLLVDAIAVDLPIAQRALIHGDARCRSIAAASILAKVHRDACLLELDAQFPHYGLARNKGYGSPEHFRGLEAHGATEHHRFSFAPVAHFPSPRPRAQLTLFAAGGAGER